MRIFAVDPGTTESGWVVYDSSEHRVLHKGIKDNHELLSMIEEYGENRADELSGCAMAIEMIQAQGMAVGATTFETCVWIGMFMHAWPKGYSEVMRLTRAKIKSHICGSGKAKDNNIRQALIDLFPASGGGKIPQVGTVKQPGPLFGMAEHMWPALAVALTACEKLRRDLEAPDTIGKRPAPRRVKLRGV